MEEENLDNLLDVDQTTPNEDDAPQEEDNHQEDPKEKRHAQQLEGSRQEAQRLREITIATASKNATLESMQELHNTDPKLANEVAKRLQYDSYDDLINTYSPKEQKTLSEEDIERIVSEREAKREHERAITKAEKIINKLSDETRELAQERFDKITAGKVLTEDDAIEFAEMATWYVQKSKTKEKIKDDAIENMASTNVSNSKKGDSDEMVPIIDYVSGNLILVPKKPKK